MRALNPALMDLQNIATHELGHGFNLSDHYAASKSALTIYGYSSEGDIAKRTLEPGDIAGVRAVLEHKFFLFSQAQTPEIRLKICVHMHRRSLRERD